MYKESVIPIIINHYNELTNVEKVIADYFISNRQIEDFSSKVIKMYLSVSRKY